MLQNGYFSIVDENCESGEKQIEKKQKKNENSMKETAKMLKGRVLHHESENL